MKLENREKEKVDLNELIQETMKLFFSESMAKHIHINLKLQDDPVFVFGDKIQLQQVLLNLLFNAANSMEKNILKDKNIEINQQLLKARPLRRPGRATRSPRVGEAPQRQGRPCREARGSRRGAGRRSAASRSATTPAERAQGKEF